MISERRIKGIYNQIKAKCSPKNKDFNNSTLCESWKKYKDFKRWILNQDIGDGDTLYSESGHFSPETCIIMDTKEARSLNIKKTNMSRYGVENISELGSIKEKIREIAIHNDFEKREFNSVEDRDRIFTKVSSLSKQHSDRLYSIVKSIYAHCDSNNATFLGKDICEEWKNNYYYFYEWALDNQWSMEDGVYADKIYSPSTCQILPSKIVKNKNREDGALFKYGVSNISKLDSVKEKRESTNLERYGVKNASSSETIKERRTNTVLDKYGKHNVFQVGEFKEKIAKTNLEKYGVENPASSEEVQEKIRSTCLKRYGFENAMQSDLIKNKVHSARVDNGSTTLYDGKSVYDISRETGISTATLYKRALLKPDYESIIQPISKTAIEIYIENILQNNGIDYIYNKSVGKYRPDFIVGDIIIEANGNYWHSDLFLDKNRHKNKRESYIKNGYRPLFFCEDEILNHTDIVESIILNKLGKSKRVFARKSRVIELDTKESCDFFETNHLMGSGRGRTFALSIDDIIYSAIRIVSKDDGVDISRFCHKIGYNMIGGFSKLLTHIERCMSPKFIQTFIDLRYGTGDYLLDLNFEKRTEYLSFSWTNGRDRLHRMKFPGRSGYDHGFAKLWDCGQAKYIRDIR